MAGIAMMIGGAVVNGLAFTGTGYLFKSLDKNGYNAEMKRHDLAQEKLQKSSVKWEEERKQAIDFANLMLKAEHNAAIDFRETNSSLDLYNYYYPKQKIVIPKKPELSDFYQPSYEMKKYEYLWIILGLSGTGLLVYFI